MSDEESDFELIGVHRITSAVDVTSSDAKGTPTADGKDTPAADGKDTPAADGKDTPTADGKDIPAADAKHTLATDANETKGKNVQPSIEVTSADASEAPTATNSTVIDSTVTVRIPTATGSTVRIPTATGSTVRIPTATGSTVRIPSVSSPSLPVSGSIALHLDRVADVSLETTAVQRTTIVWIIHGYSMIMREVVSDEFTPLDQDGDLWRLRVHPLREMTKGPGSETEINLDLVAVKLREPVRVAYRISLGTDRASYRILDSDRASTGFLILEHLILDSDQQGSIRHCAVKRAVSFRTADSTNQWLHTKTVDSVKFTNPNTIDGLLLTRVLDDIRITMDLFYLDN